MDLKPGQELDALVAEKVLGITPPKPGTIGETLSLSRQKPYSTDIAAAFSLFQERHIFYRVSIFWNGFDSEAYCELRLGSGDAVRATGDTAPHAICLAALKAVGFKAE